MTQPNKPAPGQNADRRGIQEIMQQLRQRYPHKSDQELATLAKVEATRQTLRTR